MAYPELYSDEHIVLQTQNVKVKSVSFEVVLTTRRLVLIDTKKNSIPPQEINLATLKDVESGENAIRDPTITISIITISGNTRQMVLTFSKTSGGERRREAEDWVRALRQNITTTVHLPVSPPAGRAEKPPEPPAAPPRAPPQPPAQAPYRADAAGAPPPKKRIEVARPMKKIVESAPPMPVPVETSSLPTGSFCNRCGNRVPPDSAFCNRCGTPVTRDTESEFFAGESLPAPQPPAPSVPQVAVPAPQVPGMQDTDAATERNSRPIEEVIHSIEPLIEGSVPRTAPAPLVPAKQVFYGSAQETEASGPAAQPAVPEAPAAAQQGGVQWPVLSKSGIPDLEPAAPAAPAPAAPSAPGMVPPEPRPKGSLKWIAVLAIVILAVIGGAYVFLQQQNAAPAPAPVPTTLVIPPVTTLATHVIIVPTTAVPVTPLPAVTTAAPAVPQTGVWVKVSYANKYAGTIGTPGRLRDVADSGDHFYQISTANGPVAVSVQKADGSSAVFSVDVYKDGVLQRHDTTTAPLGLIEFQTGLLTTIAPTAATTTP